MLKKAGIVVAASAAGLLALSPMAFAIDAGGILGGGDTDGGLINVSDIAAQAPVQLCNNSVVEGTLGVFARDLDNEDSHDGDCKQKNSAKDNRSNGDDDDSDDGGHWDHDGDDDDN